jgi:predicted CxxxxCH...CXXCH cytochrome family protein
MYLSRETVLAMFAAFGLVASCGIDSTVGTPRLADDLPQVGENLGEGCSACHGDSLSSAPPQSLAGDTDPGKMGVGAHRSHIAVSEASTWHSAMLCEYCHVVPAEVGSPGHMDDDDNKAELTFSRLAEAGNTNPVLNANSTCSNTYCHGATLTGGTNQQPLWNLLDGSQRECGTCHGAPPPDPHPNDESCGSCHPTMDAADNRTFYNPASHINGTMEVIEEGEQACDSCHGSGGYSAPPVDLDGNTERTYVGVGAHREHLAQSPWRREINCSNCHVVPVAVNEPTHIDGDDTAEVPFDALNPVGTVDLPTGDCSNLYCHGNGRENNGALSWVAQTPMQCDSCHQMPAAGGNAQDMSGEHHEHIKTRQLNCVECHNTVIDAAAAIINAQLHIDGQRSVSFAQGGTWNAGNSTCSNLACHENENWYDDD